MEIRSKPLWTRAAGCVQALEAAQNPRLTAKQITATQNSIRSKRVEIKLQSNFVQITQQGDNLKLRLIWRVQAPAHRLPKHSWNLPANDQNLKQPVLTLERTCMESSDSNWIESWGSPKIHLHCDNDAKRITAASIIIHNCQLLQIVSQYELSNTKWG